MTPWTAACKAPLSVGFSRQAYWSGWLFPPPGDLLDSGIKPASPACPADSSPLRPQGSSLREHVIDERHVIASYCCCNRIHTFSGLKQHGLFYSSVGQKSEMGLSGLNESVGRADLFCRLWGSIHLQVCLVSGGQHLPWLLVPFLHFQIQQSRAKSFSLCHFYRCFSASFFYYEELL